MLNYVDDNGKKYYSYRWKLFAAVCAQVVANYILERFLVRKITKTFDERGEKKKQDQFKNVMKNLLEAKDEKEMKTAGKL